MKHVLIFEKEEQAQIHQGGLVQVDAKTWIQFEGAKRRVKVINESPPEEERKQLTSSALTCPRCQRQCKDKRGLGIHSKFAHGINGRDYAGARKRYLALKRAGRV